MELLVMTFNLRVDVKDDGLNAWGNRAKKVSTMIKKHQPAVIGTQEGLLRMLQEMETDLPNYKWIGEGRQGGMKDEFCAIFYRSDVLECMEYGQFWLSENPNEPGSKSWGSDLPRICTWGSFRPLHHQGEEFLLFNTHLDHISQRARENGIAFIAEKIHHLYEKKKKPIILTGDLNSKPDNQVVCFLNGEDTIHGQTTNLQNAFKALHGEPGQTFHDFTGKKEGQPIDYIFCTPEVTVKTTVIDKDMVEGSYPSDHYPVVTVVDY